MDRAPFDKTLLLLVPLWLLCFGLAVQSAVVETGYPSLLLTRAAEPGGHPTVSGLVAGAGGSELLVGDRVLSVAGEDLAGRGHVALYGVFHAAEPGTRLPVRYERQGTVAEGSVPVRSYRMYWPRLPASLVFALAAALLTLRMPRSRMVRAFAQTFLATGIFLACAFGGGPFVTRLALFAHVGSVAIAIPLALRASLLFPDAMRPRSTLARFGPWAFLALAPFEASRFYEFPFPREIGVVGMTLGDLLFFGLLVGIASHAYRMADPVGRRQIKWVLLGIYLAVALPALTTALAATNLSSVPLVVVSMATLALIPISIVIAIARYNLFDIDDLINATASYTLIGIVLLAGVLSAVPQVATAIAARIGVEPGGAQLVLSLALVAMVFPAHRWLGPRVQSLIFPERKALAQGMGALIGELDACETPRQLAEVTGTRLTALLRPESCAIYAQDRGGFAPIFVRGHVVPPAFPAASPLVTVLQERGVPLSAEGHSRRRAVSDVSPFDRAALETLGVPVVVPVQVGDDLVGVICLGSKQSGDVYTAGDLALLGDLSAKLSRRLGSFDRSDVARETREMQAALRRYVPGALADEITQGRDLEEGQREVSVLFVDIRGYTRFAESRSAAEIFSTVNRYTRCVSEVVRKHGGSVVEFNGDGMMAVFGAPSALAAKERAAVEAGREILSSVAALPVEDEARLEVGVGIATGEAYVGNIQAADRSIWSAIGNTTNLAARLQEMTRELGAAMVIDALTCERAGAAAAGFERHEAAVIRGRRRSQDVHALPAAAAA